jgi:hypothetical protein
MSGNKHYKEDGTPKHIRCYEAKSKNVIDRFTVVFTRASCFMGQDFVGRVYYVGLSESPAHPLGFYQHGERLRQDFGGLGSRIKFTELSKDGQTAILNEYAAIWGEYKPE